MGLCFMDFALQKRQFSNAPLSTESKPAFVTLACRLFVPIFDIECDGQCSQVPWIGFVMNLPFCIDLLRILQLSEVFWLLLFGFAITKKWKREDSHRTATDWFFRGSKERITTAARSNHVAMRRDALNVVCIQRSPYKSVGLLGAQDHTHRKVSHSTTRGL